MAVKEALASSRFPLSPEVDAMRAIAEKLEGDSKHQKPQR
jgi:hypothetical protein